MNICLPTATTSQQQKRNFLQIYFQVWQPQMNLFCRAVFRISGAAAPPGGVKVKSYLLAGIGSSH